MKNCIYRYLFLIMLSFIIPHKPSFSQEYSMPSYIDTMTAYDFDSDGFNDIIVSCPSSDTIVIMFNDGVGNFTLYYYNRPSNGCILSGLIDNDTVPDLITRSEEGISFIKNLGQRSLGENQTIYYVSGGYIVAIIKDMNLDGLNDLIYTNTYPECWGILKNNGDLNFTSKFFHSGSSTTMPYAGFLDTDSLPDIVLSYSAFNKSCVFLNNGNFDFKEVVLEDHFNHNTPIMNLDYAGNDDIGLVSYTLSNIALFKYIGNEQFELQSDFYAEGIYDIASFSTDDLNRDGFDDFAITRCSWTDCTDSLYTYLNDHQWSFNLHQSLYLGELAFFELKFSDLNGDSFPDIFMKGCNGLLYGNILTVLWNDGTGNFAEENPVEINENAKIHIKLTIFPNPFYTSLNFVIHLAVPEDIEIKITDLYGNLLKKFKSSNLENMNGYSFTWNGRNENGNPYPPGVYIITARINKYQVANKVIKLE